MSNSTDEFYSVDGVSLNTLAWNIVTWGGDREAPPALRGTNILVPFSPGRQWVPKVPDSRVITLQMWVLGSTEDGEVPASGNQRAEFEKNFKALRKLLWTPRRQMTIVKRFRNYGSSSIISATAKGEYHGGMAPIMNGRLRATFTVDIELADPYYYGNEVEIVLDSSTTSTKNVEILGDERTNNITIEFLGVRDNPYLANVTEGIAVGYAAPLATGAKVKLDVRAFEAVHTPSNTRVPGRIEHAGDPFWMELDPGTQQLRLTGTSGSGGAIVRYRPAYL